MKCDICGEGNSDANGTLGPVIKTSTEDQIVDVHIRCWLFPHLKHATTS